MTKRFGDSYVHIWGIDIRIRFKRWQKEYTDKHSWLKRDPVHPWPIINSAPVCLQRCSNKLLEMCEISFSMTDSFLTGISLASSFPAWDSGEISISQGLSTVSIVWQPKEGTQVSLENIFICAWMVTKQVWNKQEGVISLNMRWGRFLERIDEKQVRTERMGSSLC